jgi:predicted amidohydrolase YtcJ
MQVAVVRSPEFNLDETVPLEEALKMYTINTQKLIMNDANKGLLQPGFVADIAIFKENLFEVSPRSPQSAQSPQPWSREKSHIRRRLLTEVQGSNKS